MKSSGKKDQKRNSGSGSGCMAGQSASCSIRVVCSALDSTPCVVLSTDNQRILFDAGEGCQRLCVEHKIKLSKMAMVCFTHISSRAVSGSPGLALTCADSGCLRLKMAGPPGLLSFWDSAAAFTHRKHQEVVIDEVRDDRSFDTGEIIVEAIPLVCQEENTNIKLGSTAATPAPTHICYVCHTKSLPGRFDVQRAKAMGVPVGPMFAKLKAGLNVILEDGSTVQSRDVIGASEPSRYVAIICDIASLYDDMSNVEVCGTSSLLERLVSNPYWSRFAPGGENYGQLECVIHYSSAAVTENPAYRNWAKQFSCQAGTIVDDGANKSGVEQCLNLTTPVHILLGKDNAGLQSAFQASTIYTRKLHMMFPSLFTPLSILQRKEANVSADDVLAVQSTLRIHSNDLQDNYDDCEMDDDEMLALGPPPLIRNPNTRLVDEMRRQESIESKMLNSDCDEDMIELNEKAGLPGMKFTLLPKSSRGFSVPLSDEDAFLAVQKEVDSIWVDPMLADVRLEIMRYLEESREARNNALCLHKSGFLFTQSNNCSSVSRKKDIHVQSDEMASSEIALTLGEDSSDRKHEKVQFSENIDSSSISVRQDCFLLGAHDTTLSFLGTGCAIPSKYRNVSGILLQLPVNNGLLLDCGEGTWQQLVRMTREHPGMCRASASQMNTVVSSEMACQWLARTIKVVWVSHPHADHHLGLVTLISERRKNWNTSNVNDGDEASYVCKNGEEFVPILVIAPPSVLNFLKSFTSSDKLMHDSYKGIVNEAFEPEWSRIQKKKSHKDDNVSGEHEKTTEKGPLNVISSVPDPPYDQQLRQNARQQLLDIGIQSLENVKVHHCFQSYGVRIHAVKGWSLVYSGDTRPCPQLVRLGKDATILIHEATFDDNKPEEAIKKRHSTISEAVKVAQDMNAHKLILTHFSQRYPSMPPLPDGYVDLPCGLLLAFDFMKVAFADLLWTHTMNPALLMAFPPEIIEEEDESDAVVGHELKVDKKRRSDSLVSAAVKRPKSS